MSAESREWIQQYEATKKRVFNKRSSGAYFSSQEAKSVQITLAQLEAQLKVLAASPIEHDIAVSEVARRQLLLENLKRSILTTQTPYNDGAPKNPMLASSGGLALREKDVEKQQDDELAEIGAGVERIHRQALQIGEEAKLHERLLDTLEDDVDVATAALQAEAKHAEKVAEEGKLCQMYICLAVEGGIILLLILLIAVKK